MCKELFSCIGHFLGALVRSYISTMKYSSSDIDSSLTSLGMRKSSSKASVTCGNTFQTSKAVFFPLPAKEDTVSHPVRARKMGLYIACPSREGDLDQCFGQENQAAPPALSTGGKLRLRVKADLLNCLKSDQPETTKAPEVYCTILNRAVIVQMHNPVTAKTLE